MILKSQSNGSRLHDLPSSSYNVKIDWERYKQKSYLHFDTPIHINHFKKYITNPNKIKSHSFFPFIHFPMNLTKFAFNPHKSKKMKHRRVRDIYYASHKDSMIYKYYGDILNHYFNDYLIDNKIDNVVIAYRTNKNGLNNIHFAKEAFNFILDNDRAYILTMDLKSFFDKIDHVKLKRTIQKVLDLHSLPSDFYKVLKSITQFTYIEQEEIDQFLLNKYGSKNRNELIKNRRIEKVMSSGEFRQFKQGRLRYNHKVGIPQGSSMSGVCANIRLIDVDFQIKMLVHKYGGIYRRYSDDMIIIIPNDVNIIEVKEDIFDIIELNKDLEVHPEKTNLMKYLNGRIFNLNGSKTFLDYLGFVFDGSTIRLREKSLFKYYSRAYRKAKIVRKQSIKKGRKTGYRDLYRLYTHLGKNEGKYYGNFITYALKAQKEMESLPVQVAIYKPLKKHWQRIQRRLNN